MALTDGTKAINLLHREIFAGHEQAIDTYTQAIADLIPNHGKDPLVDTLINQYVATLRILTQEWKEMNYEVRSNQQLFISNFAPIPLRAKA